MSVLTGIDNVVKKYGGMAIIPNLSAFVENGELLILLGPSGCGKTTLLRMIAGFNSTEEGAVQLDGKVTDDIPAQRRNIGMVFQSYTIFPHLTVHQDVEYGPRIRRVPKNQMKEQVDEILRVVRVDEYQSRLPERLSGGQQQRVALTRATVTHPQVLLIDESLSNLDIRLRIKMCSAIHDVQNQVGITTVYMTHDQEEALAISDRIIVMELGIIQQIGSPQDIYARSYNAFVSTLTGHSNLFFGTVKKQGSIPSVVLVSGCHVETSNLVDTATEGQRVVISVHPEESSPNPEGMGREIIGRTFLGKYTNYFLRFGKGIVLEGQPSIEYSQDLDHVDRIFKVGEKMCLRPDPNKINVFTWDMERSLIKDVKRYDG